MEILLLIRMWIIGLYRRIQMKYAILILALMITSCITSHEEIQQGYALCKENGGLKHLRADSSTMVYVCNNGAVFRI